MQSTHTAYLDLPSLPLAARLVHIVPALHTQSLISLGQLCDAGCQVHLERAIINITLNDEIVLTGTRTPSTGLWHLNMSEPTATSHAQANAACGSATPASLVEFAHAALFSPALSTLERALTRGYITNFPGLTANLLRKYPPQSRATAKGHLDQERQNKRSTKPKPLEAALDTTENEDLDSFPHSLSPEDGTRTHDCFATVFAPSGLVYTDQTGRFIVPSDSGNNYLFVLYDYDSNCILAEPMKNRTKPSLLAAYKKLHAKLCSAGLRPRYQRLDNECSDIMKEFMTAEGIDYQLVPPGVHRRNAAERAIRTLKNHLIAGFCSVDENFPMHLWDRILPHALLSLNMLRGSRINPKLSAHAQLHGNYDFNATPIAPPGIRVLIHEKPQQRKTWMPHAADGWYIGPALESYRCHRVWCWKTSAERICDTISWFPTKTTIPTASSADTILACLQQIVDCLQKPAAGSPLAPLTGTHVEAIDRIRTLVADDIPTAMQPPTRLIATAPAPEPLRSTDPAPVPRVAAPPTQAAPAPRVAETPPQHDITIAPAPRVAEPPPQPEITAVAPAPRVASLPPPPATDVRTSARNRRKPTHKYAANAATTQREITLEEHYALLGNAINPETNAAAEYPELLASSDGPIWNRANTTEIRRLLSTQTIRFIARKEMPRGMKATYLRIVCAFRPEKDVPNRVRWTIGGNQIIFTGAVSTKAADLTTVKTHLNSVISTQGARYCCADVKDFYLNTPMNRADYAYMRIPLRVIPQEIMDEYKLHATAANDGYVYVEVSKGMYGLKQAGRLANDQLITFLAADGYAPTANTPGLWKHATRDISFTLVVDDFGIKYTKQEDMDHLLAALRKHYALSVDPTGTKYCGLTIAWDYNNRTCDISMPGYIARALLRFQHTHPKRPEHSPHAWQRPVYGAAIQLTNAPDTSPPLSPSDTTRVQEILGTLLYYARAVDPTMLTAIGTLASQQAKGTKATMQAIVHLLNYCATHPSATIRYIASDMVLHVESDASYLSESKARSRAAGYHYMGSHPHTNPDDLTPTAPANGAISIISQIMQEVVSSAAEAELAALFHNCKEACSIRTILAELGHPQPATPIVTDNSTAAGIANDTVKQRRSKAIDMRFYWVRDRVQQRQFKIHWKKGALNHADYFSKHHPASHHMSIRSSYLHEPHANSKNHFARLADSDAEIPISAAADDASIFASTDSTPEHTPRLPSPGEGVFILPGPGSPGPYVVPVDG